MVSLRGRERLCEWPMCPEWGEQKVGDRLYCFDHAPKVRRNRENLAVSLADVGNPLSFLVGSHAAEAEQAK